MQKLLEEVRGTPHLLPVLQILLRGQGQGKDEDSQQGLLFSVSYDGDGGECMLCNIGRAFDFESPR